MERRQFRARRICRRGLQRLFTISHTPPARITMQWTGVMPALTTAFDEHLQVDHEFVARHARWQIDNGVTGLIGLGSLGEAATLTADEKLRVIETLVGAAKDKVPVVAAISALSTEE